jgi:hypothetical protein
MGVCSCKQRSDAVRRPWRLPPSALMSVIRHWTAMRLVVGIWRAALADQKSLFRVEVWQVWRRTADNNSGLRQRWWIVVTKNGNGAVPRIPVGIMASLSADMKQPVAMSLDKVIDAIAEIVARHSTSRAAVLTSARFVARDLDRSLRLLHSLHLRRRPAGLP